MSKYHINKYLFDYEKIENELIILLSMFHASNQNHLKLDPLFKSGKILSFSVTEEHVIQETLTSTAILLRMIDDKFKSNNKKIKLHYLNVGQLITKKKAVTLSFREACNKIVHASEFSLNRQKNKIDKIECLDNSINLKGYKGNDVWTAKIEVDKYVINGLFLTKYYDEDWSISAR